MIYFQDLMPHNHCWGCGADNPDGLHIKSRWETPELAVCDFVAQRPLWAGPRDVLNGGIIGVLVDCHGICTALAHAYREEDREIGSEPVLWSVTGRLEIDYRLPVPIERPVRVEARIAQRSGRKTWIACRLFAGGLCAEGRLLAIAVPSGWLLERGAHH